MFGKTNSVVLSAQSGGDGDVLYAVNNTGNELVVGDKVWLNRHLYGDVAGAHSSWGNSYTPYPIPFNIGRQMFVNRTTTLSKLDYNAGTNSWAYRDVCAASYNNVLAVNYIDNMVWMADSDGFSYVFKNSGEYVKVNGVVLSADKVFNRATSRLETFNPATGEFLSSNGFRLPAFSTPIMMYLDGNLLYYQKETSNRYIYDVTNYAAPVLLSSPVFSQNNIYAVYMTGIAPGNYVFCKSAYYKEFDCNVFYIYKINENYGFEFATDIPDSLKKMVGVKCRFSYNHKTKIFIIGSSSKLLFYKFENGAFHEFFVKFSGLPAINSDHAYLARLSDDMLTMAITLQQGSSSIIHLYRLTPKDDNWYAESWPSANPLSLVGYVTGEQDDDGKYEIKTLMPDVCRYNLTVVPEPDSVEFLGETL